ncbi:MAG: ABC transporter permease [Spirochaetaceae bacterium]|jgi:rhamnose transport system permease protein|nr:ABC transporter permease [Spirochaetaceae bacterium]
MNNSFKRFINNNIKELATLGITVLIFIMAGIFKPELFTGGQFSSLINSILLWMPLNLTMALGMMMVVIVRDIDLSIGSGVALSAMAAGLCFRNLGFSIPAGTLIAMVVGLSCGALNGFLVAYLKIPAIIVTLGTINAYRGLTYIVSAGKQITGYELPAGMSNVVSQGIPLGPVFFPWMVLIAFGIALVFFIVLNYTHFGREVYAVGSNREGAHLRGINCQKTEFLIFTITGFLCGIAGIMAIARFGYVNPNTTGSGLEFVVISATIIGGVSVSGGRGTVPGVFLGCLLLGTINTVIASVGIPGTVQRFSYGLVIVIALLMDSGVSAMQKRTKLMAYGKSGPSAA